jgi:hypothetical protein
LRGFPVEQIDTIDESAATRASLELPSPPRRPFIRAATAPFFELPPAVRAQKTAPGKSAPLVAPKATKPTPQRETAKITIPDASAGDSVDIDLELGDDVADLARPRFAESIDDDETSKRPPPRKKRPER